MPEESGFRRHRQLTQGKRLSERFENHRAHGVHSIEEEVRSSGNVPFQLPFRCAYIVLPRHSSQTRGRNAGAGPLADAVSPVRNSYEGRLDSWSSSVCAERQLSASFRAGSSLAESAMCALWRSASKRIVGGARQCHRQRPGIARQRVASQDCRISTAAATEHDREISPIANFQASIRTFNSRHGCSRWFFKNFDPRALTSRVARRLFTAPRIHDHDRFDKLHLAIATEIFGRVHHSFSSVLL